MRPGDRLNRRPTPKPVEAVVSVPIPYAADYKQIVWAHATARAEMSDLARQQHPDLTLDGVDIELVESGPHFFRPTESWSFLFRATPVWRKGARLRRR